MQIKETIRQKSLIIISGLLLVIVILFYIGVSSIIHGRAIQEEIDHGEGRFSLISPEIANKDIGTFLLEQEKYRINYKELKEEILKILNDPQIRGKYGFYFEDLRTGAWIGINERDKFLPASLFKVPLMISILKKVEEGSIKLEQTTSIRPEEIDSLSGDLFLTGSGKILNVSKLIEIMIRRSDNTAMRVLADRYVSDEDYLKVTSIMGLPQPVANEKVEVSPKEYSNIFRSLYYSSYLRRPFSEWALALMLTTEYNSQLPSGLPSKIKISHKVGFNVEGGIFHDCGIIYLKNEHYILCIMSKDSTQNEADRVISLISKEIYDYLSNTKN